YIAAVNSTTLSDGFALDLGGGSVQLVRVSGRLAAESGSGPLGTLRMWERFLPQNGPAKRRQMDALRDHAAAELARAAWLSPDDALSPRGARPRGGAGGGRSAG